MIGALILQAVLIFLNAIFSCAEIAVLSTNDTKLEKLAEEGSRGAKRLLKLKGDPSRYLSTIQVAITLAGFLGSAYASDNFAGPLVELITSLDARLLEYVNVLHSVSVVIITLILSFFSIVLGELVPKRLGMKYAEKLALLLSGLLRFVSTVFAPVVWLLTKSTNGVLRLMRINPNETEEEVSEEDIRMMVDAGSEQGTIDAQEQEMIQNIFEFDDISISEVYTHRRDVSFLYDQDSLQEWKKTILNTRHGFYPICGEDTDDVIGVLNTRKFFRVESTDPAVLREQSVEKPFFVPENMKADALFNKMKETRSYFAIVVDEYGGVSGVITLHDLLELLVGDLRDKEDVAEQEVEDIVAVSEDVWEIAGSASLDDVREELGCELEAEDCDTFGGYLFGNLGEIPDDGTTMELDVPELHVEILKVEDHRIVATRVTKLAVEEDGEDVEDEDDREKDKDKKSSDRMAESVH